MIDTKSVRSGLAALGLGAAFGCASAAGCSTSSSTPTADAAAEAPSSNSGSSSGSDASGSGGQNSAPNANLYLVNAVVDPVAPVALRFCFGINVSGDGGTVLVPDIVNAFPDEKTAPNAPVAGLLVGFGGSVSNSPQLQSFNFASVSFVVYALNAENPIVAGDTAAGGPDGGPEQACDYLVGGDGRGATTTGSPIPKGVLTEGKDYWSIAAVAQNELVSGTSWVAAVTGCVPGEDAGAALCGSSYDGTAGNLAITWLELDNRTQPDGGIGAQLAQVSTAWDAFVARLGGATTAAGFYVPGVPDGGVPTGDAGDAAADATTGLIPPTLVSIEGTAVFGDLLPKSLSIVSGMTFDGGSGFFAEAISSAGAPIEGPPLEGGPCAVGSSCISPIVYPLPTINALTLGADASNELANGVGYAFVLVGDPTASPGVTAAGGPCLDVDNATCFFNGRFVHFLAFPTK